MACTEPRKVWIRQKEAHLLGRWPISITVVLSLIVLAGGSTYAWTAFAQRAQVAASTPADLFMQSIIKRDGVLGWRQLCPELQAQVPMDELQRQAEQQKQYEASQGVTLTMEYLGMRPQATGGGEVRLYLVTAKRLSSLIAQRIYLLWTKQTGCIEGVQHVDLPGTVAQ